jgi:hypothetical protein
MVACSAIWQLFNNLYDSHRKLKQSFFKIIPLLRHLFLQSPFAIQYWFFYSSFDVGRSMFDVQLFQSVLGKNNSALMGLKERGAIHGFY